MAINTTQLFTRLGRLGHLLYTLHFGQDGLSSAYSSLYTTFGAAYPAIDGGVAQQETAAIRGVTGWWGTPAAAAQQLIFETVKADAPAAARSLPDALAELRRQMLAANTTVQGAGLLVTATALAGSVGTGTVVTSVRRGDGLEQQHLVSEDARLVCTADSYTGGATEGRETFAFVGEANEAGPFDFDWPTGSDALTRLTAVSADEDGSSTGNLLTNGDFEGWAGSPLQADCWAINTSLSTWGTHVLRSNTAYRGSHSLRFAASDKNSVLYTQFASTATDGTTAGTPPDPTPAQSYAVHFRARTVTGAASGGVFTVELTDDAGTVTADDQGVNNSFTVNANTLNTTWTGKSGVFRLSSAPPATVRLRFRLSTILAGADVLIDDVCFAPLVATYPGGPGVAVFSGNTPFQADDGWLLETRNDWGGTGVYGASFNHLFLRFLGDPTYLLPVANSPTISDGLIIDP